MLLLSKSIAQLLIPPASLILLGLIGIYFWQKRWGKKLTLACLILLWLFSTAPVRNILTSSLEYQYPAYSFNQILPNNTAIVLLGNGVQEQAPDYQYQDTLSRFGMMRTIYAAQIAKHTGLAIYATGGTPLNEHAASESSVMKYWLITLGIDATHIYEENQANTTWENATFTTALLKKKNINSVILVTSAWHMPRAVWCFEQQGLTVIPAPTDYLTDQATYDIRSFLPRWDRLGDSGDALHEYLGLFWYKLKYD
ncbi:YdcF family protein [Ghiorsea bivora]|uniref:YdcF family protein n=1 Tax=Ghiorsea bivora TaxID=1485545 RepID=UPI00069066DC|nr:YdcF family protein [Ghiorsea bivora]